MVRGRILSAAERRAAVTSERMADRRTNWPTSSLNVDNTVKSTVRRVGGSRGGTGRRRWKLPVGRCAGARISTLAAFGVRNGRNTTSSVSSGRMAGRMLHWRPEDSGVGAGTAAQRAAAGSGTTVVVTCRHPGLRVHDRGRRSRVGPGQKYSKCAKVTERRSSRQRTGRIRTPDRHKETTGKPEAEEYLPLRRRCGQSPVRYRRADAQGTSPSGGPASVGCGTGERSQRGWHQAVDSLQQDSLVYR